MARMLDWKCSNASFHCGGKESLDFLVLVIFCVFAMSGSKSVLSMMYWYQASRYERMPSYNAQCPSVNRFSTPVNALGGLRNPTAWASLLCATIKSRSTRYARVDLSKYKVIGSAGRSMIAHYSPCPKTLCFRINVQREEFVLRGVFEVTIS
jgi:hypothetical protein